MSITTKRMIDLMVADDMMVIQDCARNNDFWFLDAILRGEGWTQYGNLTDEQIATEYLEREFDDDKIADCDQFIKDIGLGAC